MYRVDISLFFVPLGKYLVDMSVRLLNVAIFQQGWFEGVIYLLRKGAKQSIAEKSGRTPLHASTYDKDVRYTMCRLTISTGESNYSKHCHIQHLFNRIPKLFVPFLFSNRYLCVCDAIRHPAYSHTESVSQSLKLEKFTLYFLEDYLATLS